MSEEQERRCESCKVSICSAGFVECEHLPFASTKVYMPNKKVAAICRHYAEPEPVTAFGKWWKDEGIGIGVDLEAALQNEAGDNEAVFKSMARAGWDAKQSPPTMPSLEPTESAFEKAYKPYCKAIGWTPVANQRRAAEVLYAHGAAAERVRVIGEVVKYLEQKGVVHYDDIYAFLDKLGGAG